MLLELGQFWLINFIKSAEPPCLSTTSVTSVCNGNEQRSSVQNKTLQSKKKRLIFLMWYAAVEGSVAFDVPRLSDSDCVNMQMDFQSV